MINYDILIEAIKLDPKNIQSQLQNPEVQKLLKSAKSRIHRNPYLRDKFYDIVSLTHQTNRANVPSIMKSGILRSKSGSKGTDTAEMIRRGFLDPSKSKVVYTMRAGKKAPLDISAIKDPVALKVRLPRSEISKRVADPLMPDYIGHNWQNYSIGKMFKHRKDIPARVDRFGNPLTFERFASDYFDMTPKQLRRHWSTLSPKEKLEIQKQFGGRFGHQSLYSKGEFNQAVRDTVALNTDIKPEWIVGSPKSIKYSFENQLKKDPERATKIINDLMKRYK